jgi:acetolactate synthase I/II/III large subunit
MKIKVSDYIARFLKERSVRHVFGIIGSGNAHIFDSIHNAGYTEIVCVHQEQAACMAAMTYYRTSGVVSAALLTTGAGSLNGVTGVVSAWADSIPLLAISSNENSKHTRPDNPLRMWGIQGYDSVAMIQGVVKYAARVMEPARIRHELEKAWFLATSGRPGPVWIDVPMNVQSALVEESELAAFDPAELDASARKPALDVARVRAIWDAFRRAKRPLLWLGHGIRLAGAAELLPGFLDAAGAPALASWAGIDMVDSAHPLVYGRAGVYGQRSANLILQNCDFLLTIGTRLAIPQVGYEIGELARAAKIVVVDIDPTEAAKYPQRMEALVADAGDFLRASLEHLKKAPGRAPVEWIAHCDSARRDYPWLGPEHADRGGYINSYRFMEKLNALMKPDQIVVTDMGTALLSGHQMLRTRPGQRLMTSTGLGEMGFGLPGAIGASFARGRGEVLCLNCDGGIMMNLQELQTVAHHRLPIKLVIFNNDGYLMIKHTQKALFGERRTAVNRSTGVSCPDFSKVAAAFGMPAMTVRTWADFDARIPELQELEGPAVCEVFMDPMQTFVPKLSLASRPDGTLVSPPLEDLSPLLAREELRRHLLVPLDPKSEQLAPTPND